jgi:hypothetical protein
LNDAIGGLGADVARVNLSQWLDQCAPALGSNDNADLQKWYERAANVVEPAGYREAFDLRRKALARVEGGIVGGETRFLEAATRGRMVVGIGVSSVWENNIALLRTWVAGRTEDLPTD